MDPKTHPHLAQLYAQWRSALLEAHERVLDEHFGASTRSAQDPEYSSAARMLDDLTCRFVDELSLERALTYEEELRVWRSDHITLSLDGKDELHQLVLDTLERLIPPLKEP